MLDKLKGIEKRFLELEKLLSDPDVIRDRNAYQAYSREHADLSPVVTVFREYEKTLAELESSRELLNDSDPEIKDLAREEVGSLAAEQEHLESELKTLLIPKDPLDNKNVIVEIRAGTGGDEAALFAADLFRMYTRYAENRGWKVEVLTHHGTGVGGFKEVIALVNGKGAYSCFKYESGTQ